MTTHRFATLALALSGAVLTTLIAAAGAPEQTRPAAATHRTPVELGAYLVKTMGCNDCHTPLKMGPKGPEPDMARALTGHPEDLKMPPAPALPAGPWIATVGATNTAWAGPWGVSFTANLTPDKETGLGDWTEAQFISAMRTGKHQGKGRAILPPMPWFTLSALVDEELKAVWAYLRSLPPVKNRVPQPIDPPETSR
ncbi:MAG: hypothetical protein R2708_20460 [Vicinamibacterales bacterium]